MLKFTSEAAIGSNFKFKTWYLKYLAKVRKNFDNPGVSDTGIFIIIHFYIKETRTTSR